MVIYKLNIRYKSGTRTEHHSCHNDRWTEDVSVYETKVVLLKGESNKNIEFDFDNALGEVIEGIGLLNQIAKPYEKIDMAINRLVKNYDYSEVQGDVVEHDLNVDC